MLLLKSEYLKSPICFTRLFIRTIKKQNNKVLKIKRFLLPQLEMISKEKLEEIIEPDFQEYTLLKEFLQQQKETTVRPSDHLEIDLALDSLDKINLGVYLETNFGIKLTETELVAFPNIVKLAENVRDKKTKLSVEAIDWGKIFKQQLDLELPERSEE